MLRFAKLVSLIGVLAFTSACGNDDESDDKPKLFDRAYVIQANEGLELAASSVSGTGTVVFDRQLAPDPEASRNLTFQVTLEDNGQLDVVTFAEANLEKGLNLSFKRVADTVSLTVEGAEGAKVFPIELADAAGPFLISVDIHNQEEGGKSHVLAWLNSKEPPAEESAYLFDEKQIVAGKGTLLGLRLTKAKVEAFEDSDAKSEDE